MVIDLPGRPFPCIWNMLHDDNYLPNNWSIWVWIISFYYPSRTLLYDIYSYITKTIWLNGHLFITAIFRYFNDLVCVLSIKNMKATASKNMNKESKTN